MPEMLKELASTDEWLSVKKLISGGRKVILVFTATWCKPCEAVYEVIEAVLESNPARDILAYKVDVQRFQEVALEYRVLSVPTVIIFNEGRMVFRVAGVPREDQIINALQS
ncbi:MAG: thioredoxin family protein [Desulfurococcales archaeon]|nr:thioredoxin family protein [Desulfurococcales archaeon]